MYVTAGEMGTDVQVGGGGQIIGNGTEQEMQHKEFKVTGEFDQGRKEKRLRKM